MSVFCILLIRFVYHLDKFPPSELVIMKIFVKHFYGLFTCCCITSRNNSDLAFLYASR